MTTPNTTPAALAAEIKRLATVVQTRQFTPGNAGYTELLIAIDQLAAQADEYRAALVTAGEEYAKVQKKADGATATVYQFHYAMKDAGWHPGRTDDNLCDIIRAKGKELAALASQAREAAEVPTWINVSDQMPPPAKPVLVVYTTHHTPPRESINRAQWIPAKFEEAYGDSDNVEYDEATDTNYTPAGWYECIDHWDDYSAVAMAGVTVTQWMPLPDLSAAPPAPAGVVRVPLRQEQMAAEFRRHSVEARMGTTRRQFTVIARAIERAHGIAPLPAASKLEKENNNEA